MRSVPHLIGTTLINKYERKLLVPWYSLKNTVNKCVVHDSTYEILLSNEIIAINQLKLKLTSNHKFNQFKCSWVTAVLDNFLTRSDLFWCADDASAAGGETSTKKLSNWENWLSEYKCTRTIDFYGAFKCIKLLCRYKNLCGIICCEHNEPNEEHKCYIIQIIAVSNFYRRDEQNIQLSFKFS